MEDGMDVQVVTATVWHDELPRRMVCFPPVAQRYKSGIILCKLFPLPTHGHPPRPTARPDILPRRKRFTERFLLPCRGIVEQAQGDMQCRRGAIVAHEERTAAVAAKGALGEGGGVGRHVTP